ncbi:MAG: efflux RND transporter permease subunit [Planctomycetes bacterium]|nr:efflux RND transporter permease subunit [Planctomycetota bacterium]
MRLSETFVRRPVMTVLLTVSVILFGVFAYLRLPVNDLPQVDYPVIQVQVGYPGASPETMAANVASPLERQFMQIQGIELITSRSTQGSTQLTLQFILSKSIDAAATDVQAAITQSAGRLPLDLPSPPTLSKTNPNDQPIQYIALTSNSVPRGRLYDYGTTEVGQRISLVQGVAKVEAFGTKSAVRVKVDPGKLASRGLTLEDIGNVIQSSTSFRGVGQLDNDDSSLLLEPRVQLERAEQYENVVLTERDGHPVYLKDVATVVDSVQDERIEMRFWARGHDVPNSTIVVAVYRQAGSNIVEVARNVREALLDVRGQLPSAIDVNVIHDRSLTIVHSVQDVEETLAIAFGLVVIVIFVFLGRASDTLIPVFALPLSILITFVAMYLLGYTLDNLSLMALTLAIGFLVDDAIVFLENTVRRMESGESALDATLHSVGEISFTIVSMTLSLGSVFIPLVFMEGIIGRIFREFSIVIIVAILASGLVSLTLTPLMCARILGARGPGARKTLMERGFSAIEHAILHVYGKSLYFFLKHKWISALAWIGCLAGTLWLFNIVPRSFIPSGDSGFLWGIMLGPDGASYKQMRRYQDDADRVLHTNPEVNVAFTMTGSTFLSSSQGLILSFLKPTGEREPIEQVMQRISGSMFAIPGILPIMRAEPVLKISVGATSQNQGQYAFAISGTHPDEVYKSAADLMAKLQAYPGFSTVSWDYFSKTPKLEIDVLRDRAASYGISVARVEAALRNAYSQNYVYLIKQPTDQYQVILEADDASRRDPEDLRWLRVRTDDGKRMIPISAVAQWRETTGLQSVNHLNQFTSVTFFFNLRPGIPIGDASDFILTKAKETLPAGVRGQLQGEAETFAKTMESLTILMILAVFVMYVILGILYESYLHPLTVLSSLPVALLGGLFTLYLFHEDASLYAFIGMFMLMGIVKKNGIMVVDFAIQRMAEGKTAIEAVHQASIERFRPIMMTTFAALMGAVPIAAGWGADGASRRPLGLVVVGGLVVAQIVTLYITPAIFLYFEWVQERVLDRVPLLRSHVHEARARADRG